MPIVPRSAYWADRFKTAEEDPEEARALLRAFAGLAEDAEDADPLLVQWIAQRVARWARADFSRDDAIEAFGVQDRAQPGLTDRQIRAVAGVLRLNRLEHTPLPDAFAVAGERVGFSESYVRQLYERFVREWRDDRVNLEWLPVALSFSEEERERALARRRVGRPTKKRPD